MKKTIIMLIILNSIAALLSIGSIIFMNSTISKEGLKSVSDNLQKEVVAANRLGLS